MSRASDPVEARRAALEVLRTLRHVGHVAFLAGGCVRDELLGGEPTDYDVATDATPARVAALFQTSHEVGASFGVVLVRVRRAWIEVATFRSDGPYSDRRRPDEVHFSDPRADARRRDFTINALFLDPLAGPESESGTPAPTPASTGEPEPMRRRTSHGVVIDYVGGLADMERKVVRAVGDPDARLAEDQLRALRAVRFASRLGFELHEPTAEAIRRHARELQGVSRERIGDEIRRMLAHPTRALAAWTLQYLGLDEPVLESPARTRAPKRLGRLEHDAREMTCLAAWLIDRGEVIEATQLAGVVARVRRALCLSNEERDELRQVLHGLGVLEREWAGLSIAAQKRAAASAWFLEALRLVRAGSPEEMVRIRRRVEELKETPSGLAPDPLISGDDLQAIGLRPGPAFKRLLEAVYDAQLEDRVASRDEALAWARRLVEQDTLGS